MRRAIFRKTKKLLQVGSKAANECLIQGKTLIDKIKESLNISDNDLLNHIETNQDLIIIMGLYQKCRNPGAKKAQKFKFASPLDQRVCTLFSLACYSYSKEVMEAFFKEPLLRLIFYYALPYLRSIQY